MHGVHNPHTQTHAMITENFHPNAHGIFLLNGYYEKKYAYQRSHNMFVKSTYVEG